MVFHAMDFRIDAWRGVFITLMLTIVAFSGTFALRDYLATDGTLM